MPNPPKKKQGFKKRKLLQRLAEQRRKNAQSVAEHEIALRIFATTEVNTVQTASISTANVHSDPFASTSTGNAHSVPTSSTSTAESNETGVDLEKSISCRIIAVENLNVNGVIIPHYLINIVGDGACLFRALSYVIYNTDAVFNDIRATIVKYVASNWTEFSLMSHDELGNNYKTANEYVMEMSKANVFGGYCELVAAGRLYPFCFEVYFKGKIYAKFGNDLNPVRRLCFSGNLSNGHFDVYMPVAEMSKALPGNRRREADRLYRKRKLERETPEETEIRLGEQRRRELALREAEKSEETETRLREQRRYQSALREAETPEETKRRRDSVRRSALSRRSFTWRNKEKEAFRYSPNKNYSDDPSCSIGSMSFRCQYCAALKWKEEAKGMCCSAGKVLLPDLDDPPQFLYTLMSTDSSEARHFQRHIRQYNACFSMTSFGATKEIREPGYMPTFKVQGQVYHRIGSIYPPENEQAKFLQLYFVDDFLQQAQQRSHLFENLNQDIILQLQHLLQQENNYVKSFKMAKEHITPEVQLLITADRVPLGEHERRFNVPTTSEVAVIISGETQGNRDIVLTMRNNSLQRIAETHRSYDTLQYPLLFWKGEDGYHFELKQRNPGTGVLTNKKISAMDFYAFRIMFRPDSFNIILRGRELFHQFIVDMFAKIESERLRYIQLNQRQLRVEEYVHLRDAIMNDGNVQDIGKLTILPSTFTGSPRYMHERTQDAMTYVRKFGRPDLFITFTCNPAWDEIKKELLPGQKPQHRHDLLARVFHLKLKSMMHLINKGKIFGEVQCFMYTIEWQKRGLPHAHILVWLKEKIHAQRIDDIISAEIPNQQEDPDLFSCITTQMVHGPCGPLNPNSPCMKNGKCSKRYPREFVKETQTGVDGYPLYRRRTPEDGGNTSNLRVRNNDVVIDNRWIVPYCPLLSKIFQAHINVEFCNSIKSIKYVCKYVNKGSDMAVFHLATSENEPNEVINYQIGRYISSNEAAWRILNFPIHERHPTVVHLAVHLENGQRVYFTFGNAVERARVSPHTTLTAFFRLCVEDDFARTLLYNEVPKFYTWNSGQKKWIRRKLGCSVPDQPGIKSSDALGRVYTIHPSNSECFHLRLLLHVVRGPQSFTDLKTVDGHVCETFKEACQIKGLLENDKHWEMTLEEAAICRSPFMLRNLFAIILHTCYVSNPRNLWEKYKEDLSDDILLEERKKQKNMQLDYNETIFNKALILIEDKLRCFGGSNLTSFGLPETLRTDESDIPAEILLEHNYDLQALRIYVQENESRLITHQKEAFEKIIEAVSNQSGGIYFLDAPGGTGKTFVLNLILAKVRQMNAIALAVASSGIAATLLAGGKTAHSTFKLPLNLATTENAVCNISRRSDKAKLLKLCKLIVWDEFTMSHKAAFEALDVTLQDIRNNNTLMGGITLLLAGDFRQTLPVIPRGTRADEVHASLKSSYLWNHVQRLKLQTNMRVHLTGDTDAQYFSEKLLQIGNGTLKPNADDGLIALEGIAHVVHTNDELINAVFSNFTKKYNDHNYLCERAILCPLNENVTVTNTALLNLLPGAIHTYKSIDTVCETEEAVNYPTEFLNSLEISGIPSHTLNLKEDAPIMLLRNLDPPQLCNGTRLCVKKLMNNVIEATIMTGPSAGKNVFIPRIPIIPSDLTFNFKRLQFPVRLSFAMTINKAQGQTLKVVGVDLRDSCFSHGQLYVACSRVGNKDNLHILAQNGRTANIVYPEALQD